jgi:hypothetical protein
MSNGFWPLGRGMFDNQSNTVSLPQLPEAQAPLLLQPKGIPLLDVEHELQLINFLYFELRNI